MIFHVSFHWLCNVAEVAFWLPFTCASILEITWDYDDNNSSKKQYEIKSWFYYHIYLVFMIMLNHSRLPNSKFIQLLCSFLGLITMLMQFYYQYELTWSFPNALNLFSIVWNQSKALYTTFVFFFMKKLCKLS